MQFFSRANLLCLLVLAVPLVPSSASPSLSKEASIQASGPADGACPFLWPPHAGDHPGTMDQSSSKTTDFRICQRITSFNRKKTIKTDRAYTLRKQPLFIPRDDPGHLPSSYPSHKRYGLSFISKTKPQWVAVEQREAGVWSWLLGSAEAEKADEIVWNANIGKWQGSIVFQNKFAIDPIDLQVLFGSRSAFAVQLDIDFEAEVYVFGGQRRAASGS